MVGIAQLVEPRIVIPVVVGSSPITHPIFKTTLLGGFLCLVYFYPFGLLHFLLLNNSPHQLIKQCIKNIIA